MKLVLPEDIHKQLNESPLKRWVNPGYGDSVYNFECFAYYDGRDTYFVGIRLRSALTRDDLAYLMSRPDFSHIDKKYDHLCAFLKPEPILDGNS